METQHKPTIALGALIGALLTPPFMVLLYIGDQFAGLPFLPFDLFDFIARSLPGPLITFGIDTMVEVIRAFNIGELDETAKLAEQTMGLVLFWLIGVVAGAVFFALMNRRQKTPANVVPGVLMGLVLALPILVISNSVNTTAVAGPVLGAIWTLLVYAGYGATYNWVYNDLRTMAAKQKDSDSQRAASVEAINRREFMIRLGGATATLTLVGGGLSALLNASNRTPDESPQVLAEPGEIILDGSGNPLPNSDATVQPAPGTRREYTPVSDHYRIDIASRPPVIDEEGYRLRIEGLVDNPVSWTLEEVRQMPTTDAFITMSCISNRIGGSLISTTKWTGVPMQHILEQVQPQDGAQAIRIESADGFDEYVSLDLIRNDDRLMLAHSFDDAPLPQRNGFPLRIHIPNRYGMKQPKWITKMTFVDAEGDGYWVRRGWSEEAIVNATSVVDTVAVDAIYERNGEMYVPVGGIAWAGDRGISRVEVRVNQGEWQEAQLRDPISQRTWVIWRYDWPFREGEFEFEVRCFEGDGTMQILEEQGVRPDGATGIHELRADVELPEPATPEPTETSA